MLASVGCALKAGSCFKQQPGLVGSKLGTRRSLYFSLWEGLLNAGLNASRGFLRQSTLQEGKAKEISGDQS